MSRSKDTFCPDNVLSGELSAHAANLWTRSDSDCLDESVICSRVNPFTNRASSLTWAPSHTRHSSYNCREGLSMSTAPTLTIECVSGPIPLASTSTAIILVYQLYALSKPRRAEPNNAVSDICVYALGATRAVPASRRRAGAPRLLKRVSPARMAKTDLKFQKARR